MRLERDAHAEVAAQAAAPASGACAWTTASNGQARQSAKLDLIAEHWNDLLRLAGSLKLGRIPATGIMRTQQMGDCPTHLAQALAEFGRIENTLHTLTYIDDESKWRATLTHLNRGEIRHSLARAVFHCTRG